MAPQIVQPENHFLRPDLDLSHADFGRDGSVSANVEGIETMEPHADPSRTYATHQYLRISRHVRCGDPETLRRIGSQQGDATATIQHGIDRLAIDQNGHTQLSPASHLDCHRGSRPNPGKVHGSAARGMPKPEATMRQIELDIIVAQHICPDQTR